MKRWTYCNTQFVADRIAGGFGILAAGVLVYSSYSYGEVLSVAFKRFGLGAEPLL